MRYYTFTDDETIVSLGEHETISDAMDNEPTGAVWTFNESALLSLASKIIAACHDAQTSGQP